MTRLWDGMVLAGDPYCASGPGKFPGGTVVDEA